MCTAIFYKNKDTYFGRNLDLERGYGEGVVITPRNFVLPMCCQGKIQSHYAMIGMATVIDSYPLYFEATNEKGLSMAGLNFPENAVYFDFVKGKENVTPFEFVPWVLGTCCCIEDVKEKIKNLNLVNISFNKELPLSPLHWMISDMKESIVVESVIEGIKIYENPFEVLTNNPPFEFHKINMSNYMGLNNGPAVKKFREKLPLDHYSLGMGALGLPGDFSSTSRFVRAVFVKENSVAEENEKFSVNQFFHILNAVAMPKGCVWTPNGYEYTRYSSCCNVNQGIYYYKTYDEFEIQSVNLYDVDLDGFQLYKMSPAGIEPTTTA